MYDQNSYEDLMTLAENLLAANRDDEALEICRYLMQKNYDHVQDVYCKYLAKSGRIDDALRFLEGRQKTFRDRFFRSMDADGKYLLQKTSNQIEDLVAYKLLSANSNC